MKVIFLNNISNLFDFFYYQKFSLKILIILKDQSIYKLKIELLHLKYTI